MHLPSQGMSKDGGGKLHLLDTLSICGEENTQIDIVFLRFSKFHSHLSMSGKTKRSGNKNVIKLFFLSFCGGGRNIFPAYGWHFAVFIIVFLSLFSSSRSR
jgi:hypothetical protein